MEKINELTHWGKAILRSQSDEVRKEDVYGKNFEEIVYKYIDLFMENYDPSIGGYGADIDEFIIFVKDYVNNPKIEKFKPNVDAIVDYVKDNWDEWIEGELGGAIEQCEREYKEEMYECDSVSPNGGLILGDLSGMGNATFPGECGEKGSGDLAMPTGKVYKQIAPFDKFIRTGKKKKKKYFRKEDEPCVHSPNKPIYDYVDDYRDYVERTYNNIDKNK